VGPCTEPAGRCGRGQGECAAGLHSGRVFRDRRCLQDGGAGGHRTRADSEGRQLQVVISYQVKARGALLQRGSGWRRRDPAELIDWDATRRWSATIRVESVDAGRGLAVDHAPIRRSIRTTEGRRTGANGRRRCAGPAAARSRRPVWALTNSTARRSLVPLVQSRASLTGRRDTTYELANQSGSARTRSSS